MRIEIETDLILPRLKEARTLVKTAEFAPNISSASAKLFSVIKHIEDQMKLNKGVDNYFREEADNE